MAVTLAPLLTLVSDADTASSQGTWVGNSGGADTEVKVQGNGSYTWQAGKNARTSCTFTPTTNLDMSGERAHLYWWAQNAVASFMEAKTTGTVNTSGYMLRVTDGNSNFREWHIAGSDTWGGEWRCFVLDLKNVDDIYAESANPVNLADIDVITWYVDISNSGNIRIIDNQWNDVVRFGTGLRAYGTDFDFGDIEAVDQNPTNMYGVLQKVTKSDSIRVQGEVVIDDNSAEGGATMVSTDETLIYLDQPVQNGLYNISFTGQGTSAVISGLSMESSGADDRTRPSISLDDHAGLIFNGNNVKRGGKFSFRNNGVLEDYYWGSNNGGNSMNSTSNVGLGESFTAKIGGKLRRLKVLMELTGSPTGNAVAKIYASTGTHGTNAKPTGSALATSDNFDVSRLRTAANEIEFTFTGTNQIALTKDVVYVWTVEYSGGDGSNYVVLEFDNTSHTHGGNPSHTTDGTNWSTQTTFDYNFKLHIESESNDSRYNNCMQVDPRAVMFEGNRVDNYGFSDHAALLWSPTVKNCSFSDNTRAVEHHIVESGTAEVYSNNVFTGNTYDIVNRPQRTAIDAHETSIAGYYTFDTTNGYTDRGQTFRCRRTGRIRYGRVRLRKVGSPTGNIYVKIYESQGDYGTDATPVGSALVTSEAIDITTLTTVGVLYEFEFTTSYTLTEGKEYVFVVNYDGATSGNYLEMPYDNLERHDGNRVLSADSTTWTGSGVDHHQFFADYGFGEIYFDDLYIGSDDTGYNLSGVIRSQSIQITKAGRLYMAEADLQRTGTSLDGNIYAHIYASTGTHGTSAVPTGHPLVTSKPIPASGISTSNSAYFDFIFEEEFYPTVGTTYCLVLSMDGYVSGTTQQITWRADNTTPSHGGNAAFSENYGSSWATVAGIDHNFRITMSNGVLIEDNYDTNDTGTSLQDPYSKFGQVFQATKGGKLTSCEFYIRELGTMASGSDMYAELWSVTGTPGTNAVPSALLATSKTYDADDLTGTFQWWKFEFDDAELYDLVEDTWYAIVLYNADGDVTNRIQMGRGGTGSGHSGNYVSYTTSWGFGSGYDFNFRVYSGGALLISSVNGSNVSTYLNDTDPEGTVQITNQVQTTLVGLQDNTEVRVYDSNTLNPQTELAGIENTSTGSFAFELEAGTEVDIVIMHKQYEEQRVNSYFIASNATSIPINQKYDRNFNNP